MTRQNFNDKNEIKSPIHNDSNNSDQFKSSITQISIQSESPTPNLHNDNEKSKLPIAHRSSPLMGTTMSPENQCQNDNKSFVSTNNISCKTLVGDKLKSAETSAVEDTCQVMVDFEEAILLLDKNTLDYKNYECAKNSINVHEKNSDLSFDNNLNEENDAPQSSKTIDSVSSQNIADEDINFNSSGGFHKPMNLSNGNISTFSLGKLLNTKKDSSNLNINNGDISNKTYFKKDHYSSSKKSCFKNELKLPINETLYHSLNVQETNQSVILETNLNISGITNYIYKI